MDETSINLGHLQHVLDNARRAGTAVAGGNDSGHTDVSAEDITADMDRMKAVLDDLCGLKHSVQTLEHDVKGRSRLISQRLDE